MLTRRGFAGIVAAAGFTEFAFAQRAATDIKAPKGTTWLNGNEFPEGPPTAAVEAMTRVLSESNRYHFTEFPSFYKSVANAHGFEENQILVGAGSTEILHTAVEAFTSPTKPIITGWPSFESGPELAAAQGHPVIKVPLTPHFTSDVKKLVAEAEKARGGLIYICNPNNPTGSMTPKADIAWTVANLPPDTILLVDEAYLHFHPSMDSETAFPYAKQGKNVIVARTFSKIYGMAGMRIGFAMARPDLISKMEPFRNAVISIASARGVLAALDLGPKFLEERRAKMARTRSELFAFLKEQKLNYIDSHSNFVMFEMKKSIAEVGPAMLAKGVAVGRPFPPYDKHMRITLGTDTEMARFRKTLVEVLS